GRRLTPGCDHVVAAPATPCGMPRLFRPVFFLFFQALASWRMIAPCDQTAKRLRVLVHHFRHASSHLFRLFLPVNRPPVPPVIYRRASPVPPVVYRDLQAEPVINSICVAPHWVDCR